MVRVNILAGGVLAFSVLASGSPSPGAEPRVHEIEIDKLAFGPAPEVLHVNDSVEWVNADIFAYGDRRGRELRRRSPGWRQGPDDFETGRGRGLFLSFPSGHARTAGGGPLTASEDS
jgi:hypothetical protein